MIHKTHRIYIQKQLENYQTQLEKINSQIEEMFHTSIGDLEEDIEER